MGKPYYEFQAISIGKTNVIAYPPGHGSPNWDLLNYWAWKSGMRTNVLQTSRINQDQLKRDTLKTFSDICFEDQTNSNLYTFSSGYLEFFKSCNLERFNKKVIGDQIFYWN
jgi:hypothetical protein